MVSGPLIRSPRFSAGTQGHRHKERGALADLDEIFAYIAADNRQTRYGPIPDILGSQMHDFHWVDSSR
jgi:hypothetical protein